MSGSGACLLGYYSSRILRDPMHIAPFGSDSKLLDCGQGRYRFLAARLGSCFATSSHSSREHGTR